MPTASSIYTSFLFPLMGLLENMIKEVSAGSISWISTAINAFPWEILYCARERAALRVQRDAQTLQIAFLIWPASPAEIFANESYKPAPDIDSRSSQFALDLTISFVSALKLFWILESNFSGTVKPDKMYSFMADAISPLLSCSASSNFLHKSLYFSSPAASTADKNIANGRTTPFGVENSFVFFAVLDSIAAEFDLVPAFCTVTSFNFKTSFEDRSGSSRSILFKTDDSFSLEECAGLPSSFSSFRTSPSSLTASFTF
mmetsp:Transcript_10640/g.32590  ORF Transcript_10640/g.32590 Transcript_10640/m.32590 type:complete len:259 (+) Transcript_10640:2904-3680(+)